MERCFADFLEKVLSPQCHEGIHTIYGWQALARFFGVHLDTLKDMNRKLKIPWAKKGPHKNSPVTIDAAIANRYYLEYVTLSPPIKPL